MENMSLRMMLQISIVMPVLLVLSMILFGQALERFYFFWVDEPLPGRLWEDVEECLERGDKHKAYEMSLRSRGIFAEALSALLSQVEQDTESLVETFQLYRQRMQMSLTRRIGLFATASFIAPLIGLLGTVLGIIRAFHDLAAAGVGGPTVVAAGISEALVTTAAGIAVAVVSTILYNFFTLTARYRMNTMDMWILELARILKKPQPTNSRG